MCKKKSHHDFLIQRQKWNCLVCSCLNYPSCPFWQRVNIYPFFQPCLQNVEILKASEINGIHSSSCSLYPPLAKKFAAKHTHTQSSGKVSFLEIKARAAAWELPTSNRESTIRETVCLQAWIQPNKEHISFLNRLLPFCKQPPQAEIYP